MSSTVGLMVASKIINHGLILRVREYYLNGNGVYITLYSNVMESKILGECDYIGPYKMHLNEAEGFKIEEERAERHGRYRSEVRGMGLSNDGTNQEMPRKANT
jgi:hypothetical protein